jgi:hypothetical protein
MSLINDALRRASEIAPPAALPPATLPPAMIPPPPPGPAPAAPQFNELRPAETKPAIHRSPVFLGVLALLLVCAIGFFFWNRKHQAALAKKDTLRPILVTSSSALKTVADAPLLAATTKGTGAAPVAGRASNAPAGTARAAIASLAAAPTTAVAAAAAPAPAPAPVFPPLRLQSVFYRSNNPLVMINGKMLAVNDQVQGVTVAAIDSSSVTLVLSGRTNVLTLR